jgi:biotin transport system substrate-specific component
MEQVLVRSERDVVLRRVVAVVLGAALVAAAAQIAVPLPGTPVPMTLQPLAVLLVGGLLGARLGALSLFLYLAMGIAGLPVFTPTVPLVGIARLLGPTGGYLLAYPVAAFATGWIAADPGRQPGVNPNRAPASINPGLSPGVSHPYWARVALGVLAGLVLIHVGGLAQLGILTGNLSGAARLGTLPFLLGDLGKLAVAAAVLTTLTPAVRARL